MKRCNAKTRKGTPCQRYALKNVKNGRCRLHGISTGAKTKAGRERLRAAQLKHGYYSKESISQRKKIKEMLTLATETIQMAENA
ncbi:MAG: HGGxSTG domain-containing protein [Pseudomonadota bacterium]